MELEGQREAFRRQHLGLAALSYDPVPVLKDFATRRRIGFPLLSDPGSEIIKRFGLLDPQYPPGRRSGEIDPHGVPYPMTLVTDARGIVTSKFLEATYRQRRTGGSMLALAGAPAAEGTEARTEHFTLRLSSSNLAVAPGQRVSLLLDFDLRKGRHAYAPGATGYRPLALRLEPQPLLTFHEPVYPPARPYVFRPLRETVPVFEGRFRVVQDVTLATGPEVAELLKQPDPQLTLHGTLDYQVCSDTICYPPARLPVSWTLKVRPLDRERAAPAARGPPADHRAACYRPCMRFPSGGFP